MFLKKISYPSITVEDLFLGNIIICFNRQLKVIGFADDFTKKELAGADSNDNRTYGMIKPNAYLNIGRIISMAEKEGFGISNLKMFHFSLEQASKFYE